MRNPCVCVFFFFQSNMASRKDSKVTPKGQQRTMPHQRLPFLRPGEESNISPSKFQRVLQYYSDEELDDAIVDDSADIGGAIESDADSDYVVSSSDSSVHSDTEEEEFEDEDEEDEGGDIRDRDGGGGDDGDHRISDGEDDSGNRGRDGGRRGGGRKRKRGILGARARKRLIVPRGRRGMGIRRVGGRLSRGSRPTVVGMVVSEEEDGGGHDGGRESDSDEWIDDDTAPQEHEYTAVPGMTRPVPTSPLGFIQLFLTRELLNYVAEETNKYALYCRDTLRRPAARQWQGCNISDIANFLGLSMLMGVVRMPSMRDYWSTIPIFSHPIFPQIKTSAR